jgi:tRNA pseudouridine65 synthase
MVAPMRILHVDAALVVVAKPSGLLVHRTRQADDDVALLQLARDATGGAHLFPVHRLDRGASGVLVMARSSEMARALHEQFEDGGADKTYWTLVRGQPPDEGVVDHPIPRRQDGPRVPAITGYRRLATISIESPERESRYSLVEARPRSGRLHQIRRHLKHLGHPVIGDVEHGRREHNVLCRDRFGLLRLALHARSLEVTHPATGERVRWEAEVPDDLRLPLLAMGFDASACTAPGRHAD